jgi:hypothetical protein
MTFDFMKFHMGVQRLQPLDASRSNGQDPLPNPSNQRQTTSIQPFDLGFRIADFRLKKNSPLNQLIYLRSSTHLLNQLNKLNKLNQLNKLNKLNKLLIQQPAL